MNSADVDPTNIVFSTIPDCQNNTEGKSGQFPGSTVRLRQHVSLQMLKRTFVTLRPQSHKDSKNHPLVWGAPESAVL
jgi:hypothetical protein